VILGIGNDLCDIRRIEKTLGRYGDRFLDRVFTDTERAKADRRTEQVRAATYAKRFAAKEACAKALGTGFSGGVFLRDIGVVNLASGQPTLALTGGAAARLAELVPEGMAARIDLTMTDEYPLAEAVVILSAIPAPHTDPA
jgi:holo-[acyl-carrier protein] synthase